MTEQVWIAPHSAASMILQFGRRLLERSCARDV
jgi:hypothetical protein